MNWGAYFAVLIWSAVIGANWYRLDDIGEAIGWRFARRALTPKRTFAEQLEGTWWPCYYDDDGGPYGIPHWVECATYRDDPDDYPLAY